MISSDVTNLDSYALSYSCYYKLKELWYCQVNLVSFRQSGKHLQSHGYLRAEIPAY